MSENKLDQEPAFPFLEYHTELDENGEGVNIADDHSKGMSKRFYAACAAMQGLLSNPNTYKTILKIGGSESIVAQSFFMADELLKQENQ